MSVQWATRPAWSRRAAAVTAAAALLAAGLGGTAQAAGRTPATPADGRISTLTGGPGGPAVATSVGLGELGPCGVAYAAGQVYVAGSYMVRSVNTSTDRLTTPVGTGLDNGPVHLGAAATAENNLNTCAVALDPAGDLAVLTPKRVWLVPHATGSHFGQALTARHIYGIAGDGTSGFAGDGGPAAQAEIDFPRAAVFDGAGNLVFADSANNRVRVVAAETGTFYGQAMTAGNIYTIAGTGPAGFSGDGGPGAAAELNGPSGLVLDPAGNLVIADAGNNRVRVLAGSTGTFYSQAMTAGNIYTIAGTGSRGFSGDGGPATEAQLSDPLGLAVDAAGNLAITDAGNNRIRVLAAASGTFYGQVMTAGDIDTVAGDGARGFSGDGGPATSASFMSAAGVAVDGSGNLVVPDQGSNEVRVIAGSTGTFYDHAMTAGYVYPVAGDGMAYGGDFLSSGAGGPAAAVELSGPEGLAVDPAGDVFAADFNNGRVMETAAASGTFFGQEMTVGHSYAVLTGLQETSFLAVDQSGNLILANDHTDQAEVLAKASGTFYQQSMTAGHLYPVAGDGTQGYSGDKGPALQAELWNPAGITVDAQGNLLLSDSGDSRVRVVAERTGSMYGQAMKTGDIYSIAGDGSLGFSGDGIPATQAELFGPAGVVVDAAGNVLLADSANNRIRVVAEHTGTYYGQAMTAHDIYTIAGGGTGIGEGGPATSAGLMNPDGVAVGAAGNVLIADTGGQRVQVVPATTGTYYGRAMTAGHIYTVAGSGNGARGSIGTRGFSGDGGPGPKSHTDRPTDVVTDGSNLVFSDTDNNRIRMVTS